MAAVEQEQGLAGPELVALEPVAMAEPELERAANSTVVVVVEVAETE